MIYATYTKPYQSPSDLIIKLKSQNLTIEDGSEALKILSSVNYFRFKIYLRPLLDKSSFSLPQNKNVLDNLSQAFGAKNLKELNSWLKLIRDVRNRVAHHSRVWNCNYREPTGMAEGWLI